MTRHYSFAQLFIWFFVIALGIEIGAGLYEALVVIPLWDIAPPDSVTAYYQHNIANPRFSLNPGRRFWMFNTPLVGVLAIATLLSGLKTNLEHRKWRITGAAISLFVVIVTFAWFVPNLILLTGKGVTEMSAVQITDLTNWWVSLNWVRAVLYSVSWLASLRAVSLPIITERAI